MIHRIFKLENHIKLLILKITIWNKVRWGQPNKKLEFALNKILIGSIKFLFAVDFGWVKTDEWSSNVNKIENGNIYFQNNAHI